MKKKNFDLAYSVIQKAMELKVIDLITGSNKKYPSIIKPDKIPLINFSLCDYMGLSTDDRIKEGGIKAIEKFGVYTAVSRTYLKLNIYEEAQDYLSKIFNKPVLMFPRTTLVHLGIIPILIDSNDAMIIDHQAHTSVRIATEILKGQGNYIETIRHNRIDLLEERIKALKDKYSKIWYLADGIYSMYGDPIPANELNALLNKYDQLYLYVDDAHGMSWAGENGQGYLLNNMPFHPHMIVTTSLGKGFGAGGGIVVCYDEKMKSWISTCASTLIFTSPVSPATIGAIIESAKIHLSSEIYIRQAELRERVELITTTASALDLPVLSHVTTPIFYLATGKTDFCNEICFNLMNRGFFVPPSQYPSVPINNSGIRATITLHQSLKDITSLLSVLKEEYTNALNKRNMSINDILKHYKTEKQLVH